MKEIHVRGRPRETDARAAARELPRVGALVLAAGRGRRMGGPNKLIEPVNGVPIVARVVDAALEAGAEPVVMVTGHRANQVEAALEGRPVKWVANPRWAEGMSTSLAAGLAVLEREVEGALVCLGDMPRVTATDLRALMDAFGDGRGGAAWVPVYEGKRGNPVLWASTCFSRLRRVRGDWGGRALLAELEDEVVEVAVGGAGVLVDVDTPAALARARLPSIRPEGEARPVGGDAAVAPEAPRDPAARGRGS